MYACDVYSGETDLVKRQTGGRETDGYNQIYLRHMPR